jgi:uncharacterized phiE125 gp8 family phage protein
MYVLIVTPPAAEPVLLAELRSHCRVTTNDEDGVLAGYLLAARQWTENYTGRALVTRTYDGKIESAWPIVDCVNRIVLPMPPMLAVESINYVDANGASQLLAANQYQVSIGALFGQITPAYGVTWPTVRDQIDAITVRYSAGYGIDSSFIPEPIRQAVLMMGGHFFEHREAAITGSSVATMPLAVESLLAPYRDFL